MTDGQYRAIVAYLNYWTRMYPLEYGLDSAIKDIGITASRSDVISQLSKAGHEWNEEARVLVYLED